MDQQKKRIDKILDATESRIQDEVKTLLGTDFSVVGGSRELVSKADAFERLSGKQVCARFDITGEIAGKGCLLIGIKDAIRLGGTLIMLPDQELQEVIGREEYQDEVEDSYGEIANIIAGSITKSFEEMYPKACRFVRKEQEILVPVKVNIDSEDPVANQTFYLMASSMLMDGQQMGELIILFPALTFGLEQEAVAGAPETDKPIQQTEAAKGTAEPNSTKVAEPVDPAPHQEVEETREEKIEQKPKIDAEKQKKKIDRLLDACEKSLTGEVGTLLGVDVTFTGIENQIVSKEDFFFEKTVGKQVLSDLEVAGKPADTCYFSLSIKDAINLGGVLIMLPPSELESVINEEEFGDDSRDAYGEVANIVSGVYTKVFEEQYQEKLRFIRKEFRTVIPGKVVTDSDEPIPDKAFYCHTMQLLVAGKSLGMVHMLFPAQLLGLDGLAIDSRPATQVAQASNVQPPVSPTVAQQEPGVAEDATVADIPKKKKAVPSQPTETVEKQKRLVDKLLSSCRDKMADEVSALLGTEVKLSNQSNKVVSKEALFFEELSGKQVIAHMDVVGELKGKSYLVVNLKDAIRIGGVLIMLPSQELESVVSDEVLGEDTKDAYSEVANIMAGVYTAIFEEQYAKKIRFVKTELQQIVPMKVDIESDDPLINGNYYFSSLDLTIGDTALGKVNIVFPLGLFELEGLLAGEVENAEDEDVEQSATPSPGKLATSTTALDILLIGDDELETAKIAAVLGEMHFAVKSLSFKDNVHNYIPGALKAIYLVMEDVNEQVFGAAIKISTSCSLPLIAAGPSWTRTKVIKAVRYGIRDILLTPASKADIEENITNNLLKLAA